ncbi:MAG TPA: response regulator [Thermomicrobiales bacterium]|nr:response regulator [Thermomicrobiales bacterium]
MDDATGPHILVIDDEPGLRDLLCEVFAEEGYRVSGSGTLFDDVDLVRRLDPDLILLDIVIRGQSSGMIFLERLKADPRTVGIPIAVCTAATHLTAEIQTRLTEWDCLIVNKPFDLDELLAELDRCLKERDLEPVTA